RSHAHGHSHSHSHAPSQGGLGQAFLLGILLNLGFLGAEVVYGVRGHSLALIADAAHNFGDVLSLCLAWAAAWLGGRMATDRRTYGFRRAGIMAALVNGSLLLVAVGGILWEALRRLAAPEPSQGMTMIVVACVGTVINLGSALLFLKGDHRDLNIRGAFLHLLADAGVSLGVVVAGLAILGTGWLWLDPAVSLLVGVIVLLGSWPLFRSALDLSLDAVPAHIDLRAVREFLREAPGVRDMHHLHVWAIGTTSTALSVHLVVDAEADSPELVQALSHGLHERFDIDHATIQVEYLAHAEACLLTPGGRHGQDCDPQNG
ncbi:MAG TPA: cation diffusion facilitator family transporter, partial [Holophaga sp.]|nr:cation diffusion facilitator family transporter [Holophaga sp.]